MLMRASVRNRTARDQKHEPSHSRWWMLKTILWFAILCAMFLGISSWYQSYTDTAQKTAQTKAFADLDARVKATLQKRFEIGRKAEASAKANSSSDQAARTAAAAANPSGTKSSQRCDVVDPTFIIVIVNKKHCIDPPGWQPSDLVELGEFSLRKEAAEAFSRMRTAASQAGHSFEPSSAYRSYAGQVATYNSWIETYGNQAAADQVSARPGFSEHQTGLAVDLRANTSCALDCFGKTSGYTWLTQHAADYGFIERYPAGLTSITGYSPEVWHWRYVGTKVAKDMKDKGIQTLEMYRAISGGDYSY